MKTSTTVKFTIFIVIVAIITGSSSSSSSSSIFVSAQSNPCNLNDDCVSGQAWAVIPNAESPTGCQCRCEDFYEGWRCESCIANTNPTCTGCRANEGDASWSYDQSTNKCTRPCTSLLDCNDHALAIRSGVPGQPPVFPPLSNCGCVCRNQWRTTSQGNCIECPIMYAPDDDCASCGNGYTGDYPDGCVKPCLNSADCNSNAINVSGIWRGEVSECQCTCKDQWAQPDCGKCEYPYSKSPEADGGSCDRCADNRDQSTYPDCIGSCNITENCTAYENAQSVTRVGGQCVCSCRLAWEGANQSDCSVCDLKNSVMRRGDCWPKTATEELTPTDSVSLSDTMSSSASETASPSISSSVSPSESASLSSSSSTSVSVSQSSSQSVSDPSHSLSDTIPETRSNYTFTLSKSESLSIEPTHTDTIVVCFMRDCGNGTADTFYSNVSRRCLCNCRTNWDNETKCESCPFNFNNTMRPEMKQYLLDKQREEQQFQQQQQNIIDAGGTTTTTTEAPPSSPQEQVFDPQSNFTDFYFHDCDYCAFGFFNRTSLREFPHNATCDCASHVLTEMSVQTAVGVPEDIDDFIHAFSDDIKAYLNTKCFGIIDFFVFPYASVVNLGSNTIRTQLEVIALTPPQMAISQCLLKPSATACLLSALTDPSKTPPPASPNGGGQLGPRPFCIPIKSLLNVTNATVPAGQDDACFDVHINPTVPDTEFPSNLLPREVPYSPCANITRLNCPNFEEFNVIPAPIPDYLWLILLILGGALLLLAIIALCCWRYFPVFAAWRERKRKQKRDEMLLAMKEAEMEEQMMLQEELLKGKDADCLVIDDDDVSAVSSCSDDDEYRAKQEKMKQLKLMNQSALLSGDDDTTNINNKKVAEDTAAVTIDDNTKDAEKDLNENENDNDDETRLMRDQLGVTMTTTIDDFSPPKRADLKNLKKRDKRKRRSDDDDDDSDNDDHQATTTTASGLNNNNNNDDEEHSYYGKDPMQLSRKIRSKRNGRQVGMYDDDDDDEVDDIVGGDDDHFYSGKAPMQLSKRDRKKRRGNNSTRDYYDDDDENEGILGINSTNNNRRRRRKRNNSNNDKNEHHQHDISNGNAINGGDRNNNYDDDEEEEEEYDEEEYQRRKFNKGNFDFDFDKYNRKKRNGASKKSNNTLMNNDQDFDDDDDEEEEEEEEDENFNNDDREHNSGRRGREPRLQHRRSNNNNKLTKSELDRRQAELLKQGRIEDSFALPSQHDHDGQVDLNLTRNRKQQQRGDSGMPAAAAHHNNNNNNDDPSSSSALEFDRFLKSGGQRKKNNDLMMMMGSDQQQQSSLLDLSGKRFYSSSSGRLKNKVDGGHQNVVDDDDDNHTHDNSRRSNNIRSKHLDNTRNKFNDHDEEEEDEEDEDLSRMVRDQKYKDRMKRLAEIDAEVNFRLAEKRRQRASARREDNLNNNNSNNFSSLDDDNDDNNNNNSLDISGKYNDYDLQQTTSSTIEGGETSPRTMMMMSSEARRARRVERRRRRKEQQQQQQQNQGENNVDNDNNEARFSPRTSSGRKLRQMMRPTAARAGKELWESLGSSSRININDI